MKYLLLTVLLFSFLTCPLFASLDGELTQINNQISATEARISSLEAELARLLAENKQTEVTGENEENFSFSDNEDNYSGEYEDEYIFEEPDPSEYANIKQSIEHEKAMEGMADDRRVAEGAQSLYEDFLREQEEQRIAMQEFGAGLESVGMGLQEVHSQYLQNEAQMKQMAAENRSNVASAMNSYSNAYKTKMESSGYNNWKKSVSAQASGQTNNSNYNNQNYYTKTNKPAVEHNNSTKQNSNSSKGKGKGKNWWIMCRISGDKEGTLQSTNYYLVQSNSPPGKRVSGKSLIGIASGPYNHTTAKQKLRQVNNSALKINVNSEKDAEKTNEELKKLMMNNPEFKKKYPNFRL
jgi:hypothetical protein